MIGQAETTNTRTCYAFAELSVMIPARYHIEYTVCVLIHETVCLINALLPKTAQTLPQRFRFTQSFKWSTAGIVNELIDAPECFLILALPPHIIFPCCFSKADCFDHSTIENGSVDFCGLFLCLLCEIGRLNGAK